MNLVDKSRQNWRRQRMLWMERMRDCWIEEGESFQKRRVGLGIAISRAARNVGVGTNKLRQFEAGEAIKDAKVLRRIYDYYLENETLKSRIEDLRRMLD